MPPIIVRHEVVRVPDTLVEALADLRIAFANLLHSYKKEIQNSPNAQKEFVEYMPLLFGKRWRSEDSSFQTYFQTLIDEEISLFNVFYLKRICNKFPEEVR